MLDFIHNRNLGSPASTTISSKAAAGIDAVLALKSAAPFATWQRELCVFAALADHYHVPRLLATVLHCLLEDFLLSVFTWQAVLFLLHSTHDGIGMHPRFPKPYSLAVQYTLQQLQDLEAVLQDRGLSQVLLLLPAHVLLMLVQGPDTRVTWESTVVAAISTW
jgi:hypothetical protein